MQFLSFKPFILQKKNCLCRETDFKNNTMAFRFEWNEIWDKVKFFLYF